MPIVPALPAGFAHRNVRKRWSLMTPPPVSSSRGSEAELRPLSAIYASQALRSSSSSSGVRNCGINTSLWRSASQCPLQSSSALQRSLRPSSSAPLLNKYEYEWKATWNPKTSASKPVLESWSAGGRPTRPIAGDVPSNDTIGRLATGWVARANGFKDAKNLCSRSDLGVDSLPTTGRKSRPASISYASSTRKPREAATAVQSTRAYSARFEWQLDG